MYRSTKTRVTVSIRTAGIDQRAITRSLSHSQTNVKKTFRGVIQVENGDPGANTSNFSEFAVSCKLIVALGEITQIVRVLFLLRQA